MSLLIIASPHSTRIASNYRCPSRVQGKTGMFGRVLARPGAVGLRRFSHSASRIKAAVRDDPVEHVFQAASLPFDTMVERLAAMMPLQVTIAELIKLGQQRDNEAMVESSRLVQAQLPIRLAQRVDDLRRLPFIVGCNPHVRSIYDLYSNSLKLLLSQPPVTTPETAAQYCEVLKRQVEEHVDVIPILSRGMMECRNYVHADEIHSFLDKMIHARIGIRLLAESHLSLSAPPRPDFVGIVNRRTSPKDIIRQTSEFAQELCGVNYGLYPELTINGHTGATFSYIPVHLEYIVFELLKNAMRASVEWYQKGGASLGQAGPSPIEATIGQGPSGLSLRFRDRGGGVPPDDLASVWLYSFTTRALEEDQGASVLGQQAFLAMQTGMGGPLAGLGYGLPMSRKYAEYFGGSLELVSLFGHGCDVFVHLRDIGDDYAEIQ